MREKLFSVSSSDCDWQDMTAGGPGGQHQNRRHTAIRCLHRDSGAVGVSREFKSQIQNKRAAFRRMSETPIFKAWVKMKAAALSGTPTIEQQVENAMEPHNLRIEVWDGIRWREAPELT